MTRPRKPVVPYKAKRELDLSIRMQEIRQRLYDMKLYKTFRLMDETLRVYGWEAADKIISEGKKRTKLARKP